MISANFLKTFDNYFFGVFDLLTIEMHLCIKIVVQLPCNQSLKKI